MAEFLGAAPGERTQGRLGYRAGYYSRGLITRIGKIELRVPRDRNGEFCTVLFERFHQGLDETLTKFARRRLTEDDPYLIVVARYERVRENGVIQSQAVLIAIAISWEGQRRVLGIELANRESQSSWRVSDRAEAARLEGRRIRGLG